MEIKRSKVDMYAFLGPVAECERGLAALRVKIREKPRPGEASPQGEYYRKACRTRCAIFGNVGDDSSWCLTADARLGWSGGLSEYLDWFIQIVPSFEFLKPEPLAEFQSGPVELRLAVADRTLHEARDFAVFTPLHVVQDEDGSVT